MELTKRRSLSLKILPFCLAFLILAAFFGSAQATFVYARTSLTIYPVIAPIDPSQPRSAERKVHIQATKPIHLPAEIRPASSFQTPSLYLRQTLQGNHAYLIPLPHLPVPKVEEGQPAPNPPPPQHKIEPSNVYAPVDVLAIDPQGSIIQIWPSLLISSLTAPIMLPVNTHAVLYLAAGRAEQLGITPLDRVEHDLFTPPPASLQ